LNQFFILLETLSCIFLFLAKLYLTKEKPVVDDIQGLTGEIPSEISQLTKLDRLNLDDNDLSGPLPDSIYELDLLRILFLDKNSLNGTISSSMNNMTSLTSVSLNENMFHGTIPNMTGLSLDKFDVRSNNFTGVIPVIGTDEFRYTFDFSSNDFTGTLPNDYCEVNVTYYKRLSTDCLKTEMTTSAKVQCSCCYKCCNLEAGCNKCNEIRSKPFPLLSDLNNESECDLKLLMDRSYTCSRL